MSESFPVTNLPVYLINSEQIQLALVNNFVMTKKFLNAKFDCNRILRGLVSNFFRDLLIFLMPFQINELYCRTCSIFVSFERKELAPFPFFGFPFLLCSFSGCDCTSMMIWQGRSFRAAIFVTRPTYCLRTYLFLT